jgi:pSer/pThr/pTyr-binding forkhead associated (FHA) protein
MNTNSMELFLQACRWAGPLRLSVAHPNELLATQTVLRQPFALAGSDPRSDLFLSHPEVSRRHAYLQLLGGRLFCVDLQSRTGLHWQDGAKRSGWLEVEEPLRIGPFRIQAARSEEPSSAGQEAEEELPNVALEFVNRLPEPTVWRMGTMLALVGRAPLCRVRLMGESVSKFHCSLVRTPLGVWVVDLFGKGGISVNEMPVRCARLEDGDRLQVGHFIIRTRFVQPPVARIPFSHLVEETGPTVEQPSGILFAPALQDTALSAPAASLTQEMATLAEHQPAGQALTLVGSPSGPAADGTPPQAELPLSLLPQVLPTPAEAPPGNMEVVQALLVPIAQQLGTMQHQMFEQFQQAMMMMFQMFGKLQREQIKVIRDEMDRLHQLSREVLALQAELAKHSPAAAEKPRVAPRSTDHATTSAVAPRTVPAYSPAANPSSRPGQAASPMSATESKPLPMPQKPPEKDMHAWLSQRIAALQQERQSRWQKIVSFLGGLGSTAGGDGQP